MGERAAQGAGMRREAFEQGQTARSALPQPCPAERSVGLESCRWVANSATGESTSPFFCLLIELRLINIATCGSLIPAAPSDLTRQREKSKTNKSEY